MMLFLSMATIFSINVWYLFSVRQLMTKLKDGAADYWEKIGRPDSFAASHGMAILSNLYKPEMSKECNEARIVGLLTRVRVLLPTTFFATGLFLFVLANLLNTTTY